MWSQGRTSIRSRSRVVNQSTDTGESAKAVSAARIQRSYEKCSLQPVEPAAVAPDGLDDGTDAPVAPGEQALDDARLPSW
jgi:hypothetical protein